MTTKCESKSKNKCEPSESLRVYGEAIKKNCPLQDVYASCSHQLSQRKNIPKDYRNMIERGERGESDKTAFCLCVCLQTNSNWEVKVKIKRIKIRRC